MKRPISAPYSLFLCLILSLPAAAQKNLQDGYIILRNKDTVWGQIDFKEWAINPQTIFFQDRQTGNSSVYSADQLNAFHVSSEHYDAFQVKLYPYSFDAVLVTREDFSSEPYTRKIFLRLITAGKSALYYYKDSLSVDYFFIRREGGEPVQLRIKSYVAAANGHTGAVFDESYKNQLFGWFSDCPGASGQVAGSSYTERSLRKLVFSYNHCGEDTAEQRDVKRRSSVQLFPMIGYFTSKLRLKGGNPSLTRLNFPAYNSLTGGVGALFMLPRNRQQFAFTADLLYNHFASTSNLLQESNYLKTKAVLNYSVGNLDILFRYTYPKGKVRPFVQAGVSNSVVISNKSTSYTYNSLDNTVSSGKFLGSAFHSFWVGWLGAAGVRAGRLSIEARMNRGLGMSDLSSTSSPITSFYFLVAWSL